MKSYSFVFLLFVSSVLFSREDEKWVMATQPYIIVSDEYNSSVPDGYFALIGHVYDANSNMPVKDAGITNYVENQTRLSSTTSDSSGHFKIIFPITDTLIYCYKLDLNEVVLKGPFKNRHVIKVKVYLQAQYGVAFKPVIYAYNASSSVSLQLRPVGELTYTYPKSNGNWSIKTNEYGMLTDLNTQKNYPYIFWEGLCPNLKFDVSENKLEGFLIKTDTCIQFLENTLAQFGLNERESADFITFWGPRMIQKDFALIQFLSTEEYGEAIAELSIEPSPNSLLRLYMYVMPLDFSDLNVEIVVPKIESFQRTGFTIVEWGGSVLQENKIIN